MAARSRTLAKLTRPKLYDALPRPRLFALLDEAATRPIVWVCAPPGAGKTTLVASYLEARGLRHLWYQVDVGDADTATFVHYLRIAAQQLAGKAAASLPLFTSEPQQNLARFARGFFRDLFSALPHPCVVVFDNFHEARTRARAARRVRAGAGGDPRRHHRRRDLARRSAARVRAARRESAHRAHRRSGAPLHGSTKREAILGGKPIDRAAALQRIQRAKRRLGGRARPAARAPEPPRRHARRVARRRQGRDLPVLRRRDLQRRATGEPARADADGDSAVDHRRPRRSRSPATRRRRACSSTSIAGICSPIGAAASRRRYHYHALFREFLLGRAARGGSRATSGAPRPCAPPSFSPRAGR